MSRSGGLILIQCDCCGEELQIEMTMLAKDGTWDTRNIKDKLNDNNWIMDDEDLDFCSEECAKNYKVKGKCSGRRRERYMGSRKGKRKKV